MIRTIISLSVFLIVVGGLLAAAGNALAMQCGASCGPLGDAEQLRQVGIAASLAGLVIAPALFAAAVLPRH